MGLPSWGPGGPVPELGAAGPIRSVHVCWKRRLWWGLKNMPNPVGRGSGSAPPPASLPQPPSPLHCHLLCSRGKSSGLEVVSAATTATTFSKSSSCL